MLYQRTFWVAASLAILSAAIATNFSQAQSNDELLAAALDADGASLDARTLLKASKRIEYRSEVKAPVKSAGFQLGQRFSKGEKLVEFDCRQYEAAKKAAAANTRAADIEFATQKRLHKFAAAGKNDVDRAEANLAKAQAELEGQAAQTDYCTFEAPFDGRVVELNVKEFEFPPSDKPLIVIIDDSKLEMELVVPSSWLAWLKPGEKFDVDVDDVSVSSTGVVTRVAAEVDPISRTVRVVAEFEEQPASVLAGMSGRVRFAPRASN